VVADIKVNVSPAPGSEVRFGDGEWSAVPRSGVVVRAVERPMTITARNPCCEMVAREIRAGQVEVDLDMRFKPGRVLATCDVPDTTVQIDEKSAQLGKSTPIFLDGTLDSKTVKVTFISRVRIDSRTVQVRSAETTEVKCAF
jgi:hypothetical protein